MPSGPIVKTESAVASVQTVPQRSNPQWAGAAEHIVRLIHPGSTSAAGRGHTTPTPDPDPRGPGLSTPCALRSCNSAPSDPDDAAHPGHEDGASGSSRGLQPTR